MARSPDSPHTPRSRRPVPRLATVLLLTNLAILLLPLGSIGALRILENELIRRTEAELIAQGTVVGEAWRQHLAAVLEEQGASLADLAGAGQIGVPAAPEWLATDDPDGVLHPVPADLDRGRDPIWPRAADPPPATSDRPAMAEAGRRLTPLLQHTTTVTLAGIRVVDVDGVQVASTRGEAGLDLSVWDEVPAALRGEPVRRMRERLSDEPTPPITSLSRRTRVRVFVALPVFEGDRVLGAVVLSRTPISLRRALYDGRHRLIGAGLALLAVVVLVSTGLAWAVTRPMRRLVRRAERVADGDRSAVTADDRPGTAELARVQAAFDRMTRVLVDREAYIRTFATGVSHEFKTPLTAMKGAAELLSDHGDEMSDDERARFVGVIERECDRLERLVARLLELARADVLQPEDAAHDLFAVADGVARRAVDRGHDVVVDGAGPLVAAIDAVPATTILDNLVENAVQHGGDDVRVRIGLERVGDSIVVDVDDDGPGISDANAARVFESFFTTARRSGGTGVGLAIVRTLVTQHRGTIDLIRTPERTRFRVTLPVAPTEDAA